MLLFNLSKREENYLDSFFKKGGKSECVLCKWRKNKMYTKLMDHNMYDLQLTHLNSNFARNYISYPYESCLKLNYFPAFKNLFLINID